MKRAIVTIFFWLGIGIVMIQSIYSVAWLQRCGSDGTFWELYQTLLNGC